MLGWRAVARKRSTTVERDDRPAPRFGRTLRVLRTTAGLSIRHVAESVGLGARLLGEIERGIAPVPGDRTVSALAEVIGVPPALLVAVAHRPGPSALDELDEIAEASEFLAIAHRVGLEPGDYAALGALLSREGVDGFRRRLRSDAGASNGAAGDADGSAGPRVKLAGRLDESLVFAKLHARTGDEVLSVFADRLADRLPDLDRDRIEQTLARREAKGSTGLGDGVAVPHGAFDELADSVLSVGTVPVGVAFDAPDGAPVRVFFVVLGPTADGGRGEHLGLLARVARMCLVPGTIKKLARARTSAELHKRLRKLDRSLT